MAGPVGAVRKADFVGCFEQSTTHYLRASGNSQGIDNPFDLPIAMSLAVVVLHEQLVCEQGRQQLGSVVAEPAMPDPVLQFKEPLEPVDKRLDGTTSTAQEAPSPTRRGEGDSAMATTLTQGHGAG